MAAPDRRRRGGGWAIPADSADSHELGELFGYQLGYLGGVERGTFAEVVAADEELQAARFVQRAPQPPDPGRVGPDDVGRGGEFARGRVIAHDDAWRVAQDLACCIDVDVSLEHRVDSDRVRRHDGNAYAGGIHAQRRQAEDLARLVPDLELLGAPAIFLERPGPGHDVEREWCRKRTEVADRAAQVARPRTEGPVGGDLGELISQRVDTRLTGPGRGLYDETTSSRSRTPMQRTGDDDHRQRRAVGLAMMPRGRLRAASALTSGTTSGTSAPYETRQSCRPRRRRVQQRSVPSARSLVGHVEHGDVNAVEAILGERDDLDVSPRTEHRPLTAAMQRGGCRPTRSFASYSRSRITVPTAPVAPTTARVGRPERRLIDRTSVHGGHLVSSIEIEAAVQRCNTIGHRRYGRLRRCESPTSYHFDVDTGVGDGAEELRGHTRVGTHASTDK